MMWKSRWLRSTEYAKITDAKYKGKSRLVQWVYKEITRAERKSEGP